MMDKRTYTTPAIKIIETHLENALALSLEFGKDDEERDVWSVHGGEDFQVDEDYCEDEDY